MIGESKDQGHTHVEQIKYIGMLMAIIVRANFHAPGITFFTENDLSQQLAYMSHPKGRLIQPHIHNSVPREVKYTQEVLFIKSGKLKVNFYNTDYIEIGSRLLSAGDVILLMSGGHGFEVIEDVEMFEVKQGPYAGENDKTRFNPK